MTAKGELYLDEDCRDYFAKELDKVFGKDKWRIDASDYSDCWNVENFPRVAEVKIKDDETGEVIGTAEITSRFEVEEDYERYIQPYPDKIEIKKVEKVKQMEGEKISLLEAIENNDKQKIKKLENKSKRGEVIRII